MRVAYRVDGGGWRGLGHVARCEALVPELQALGVGVEIATRAEAVLPRLARLAPTKLLVGPSETAALAALGVDRVIVDLPHSIPLTGLPRPYVVGRSHCGDWSRALIRCEIVRARCSISPAPPPWRIYVSGGGTDAAGLLVPLLEAVGLLEVPVEPVVADGSRSDVGALMSSCHVAAIAYGVTALEAACVGLPAVYVAATDGHAVGARALMEAGCGIYAGVRGMVRERDVAGHLATLIDSAECRTAMAAAGHATVDGRGAQRVAREILEG